MMNNKVFCLLVILMLTVVSSAWAEEEWTIDTKEQWTSASDEKSDLNFKNGVATPTAKTATFKSQFKRFSKARRLKSMVVTQAPLWQNWQPVDNIGPTNLGGAQMLLTIGPDNYWMFGRYKHNSKRKKFDAEDATLEGFDVPLKTTPFDKQFDAPGGLQPVSRGFHAWQSRDMEHWVHHGPITKGKSRWVTSAEHVDGKTYIYYDYPNDQDPHLYIDSDLTDGKPGVNKGKAFDDPSDGSDCGVIRDLQGRFHLIYEDWSPINARANGWDSPLGGHAVSDDGIDDFKILPPAVDDRTEPTGKFKEYGHPHWGHHPDYSGKARYEVHKPAQNAYGDWAPIAVGGRYYLFSDFHKANGGTSMALFTSSSLDEQFTLCGKLGKGHPDPDIGFAEGKFYLVSSQKNDYVSPGPWVETVEARIGVDTDGDGKIDRWTDWQEIRETYRRREGFAKQIDKTPAKLVPENLPAGRGFVFELRLTDTTENKSKPMINRVDLRFE